jgi:hypothetical protein
MIDKMGLKCNMFVGYNKFKNAFRGLFNSFSIHSEALVTAVFLFIFTFVLISLRL